MTKFKIFLSIFSSFLIAIILWYGLVFARPNVVNDSLSSLSNTIFLNSTNSLNQNTLVLTTSDSIWTFSISWDCSINSTFKYSEWSNHYFDISIWDKNCQKNDVEVVFKNKNKTLKTSFKIIKDYDLYFKYLDYSTEDLEKMYFWLKEELKNFEKNRNSKQVRNYLEIEYFEKFFENILEKRKQKYITPVKWLKLPKRETKVPNSPRPYRSWYTDWIHHGWDFDAKKMTPSIAIDDGIIIRVVKWFTASDFLKIQKKNMTEEIKLKNLDILRWNQVWLKTMKWDVAFYSHFEEISPNIKVWSILKKWDYIWKIWATWVPEDGYSDFHMHMALHKNPLDTSKSWNYSFMDIMAWPWYFKWQTASYVLTSQYDIFQE